MYIELRDAITASSVLDAPQIRQEKVIERVAVALIDAGLRISLRDGHGSGRRIDLSHLDVVEFSQVGMTSFLAQRHSVSEEEFRVWSTLRGENRCWGHASRSGRQCRMRKPGLGKVLEAEEWVRELMDWRCRYHKR